MEVNSVLRFFSEAGDIYHGILLCQCGLLLLLGFWFAYWCLRQKRFFFLGFAVFLVCALFFLSFLIPGRPVLSLGILQPGSFPTRLFNFNLPPDLRRFLEPSIWFTLIVFVGLARSFGKWAVMQVGLASLLVIFSLEILTLRFAPLFLETESRRTGLVVAHATFQQIFLCCFLYELFLLIRHSRGQPLKTSPPSRSLILNPGVIISVFLISCLVGSGYFTSALRPLIGAHYYSWFPENWQYGYVGEKLIPPVQPLLGEYHSDSHQVYARHVKMAHSGGIDFFVFDWWARRPFIRKRFFKHTAQTKSKPRMLYSLQYEIHDLKHPEDAAISGEDSNIVFMTEERIARLKSHWTHIAKHYFDDPMFLRIEGRPVLFIYATRHMVGPVASAIQAARREVEIRTGHKLFLVADEAFFNVLSYSQRKGIYLLPQFSPEWSRLRAFDAITCYNAYDSSRKEHGNEAGAPRFLHDVEKLYERYQAYASTLGIAFFPGVLPGYNDRGVRLKDQHYVIPRRFGESGRSFFDESLKMLARPFLDSRTPLFVVTSWNEWNEGTQIEPSKESPPTVQDVSPSSSDYTTGVPHFGYGKQHLEELQGAFPRSSSGKDTMEGG